MDSRIRCDPQDTVCDIGRVPLPEIFRWVGDLGRDDAVTCDFLVRPRTALAGRGVFVPTDTRLSIVSTEELRARLLAPEGVAWLVARQRAETAKIKLHVKDGVAKCVRIEFECPKKKGGGAQAADSAPGLSLARFAGLVAEAETDDAAADELVESPRRYFEARGFLAPPGTRFHATPSESLFAELSSERGIDDFLDRQAAAAFEVHIAKGKGKCVTVTVECDK